MINKINKIDNSNYNYKWYRSVFYFGNKNYNTKSGAIYTVSFRFDIEIIIQVSGRHKIHQVDRILTVDQ